MMLATSAVAIGVTAKAAAAEAITPFATRIFRASGEWVIARAVISGDGKHAVYVAAQGTGDTAELFWIELDTGRVRLIDSGTTFGVSVVFSGLRDIRRRSVGVVRSRRGTNRVRNASVERNHRSYTDPHRFHSQ